MVQTRAQQKAESPVQELPYRKRKAARNSETATPTSSAKKVKRDTPRSKLPIRLPSEDESAVTNLTKGGTGAAQEAEEPEISIYETPATHGANSVYATPATHIAKNTEDALELETPSQGPRLKSGRTSAKGRNIEESKSNAIPAATATRIRFDSEEPLDSPAIEANADKNNETPNADQAGSNESVEDDSDDAPDVVTADAATQKLKEAQSGATKARQAQEEAVRSKRRKRDQLLQKQALKSGAKRRNLGARKRQAELETDSEDDQLLLRDDDGDNQERVDDLSGSNDAAVLHNATDKLPKYLPQEFLDAAPAVRPLSPPPAPTTPALIRASKTNQLAILDPKQPRDVTRGPVRVRVMQDTDVLKFMPPKAERRTGTQRDIRETWMLGRPGRLGQAKGVVGSGKVERKAWGGSGGFLRS